MPLMTAVEKQKLLDQSFHDVAREKQLAALLEATEGRGSFPHKPTDDKEGLEIAFHELEKQTRQTLETALLAERVNVAGVAGTLFSRTANAGAEPRQDQENVQKPNDSSFRPGQD